MSEEFKNLSKTTLNGGIDNSTTSIIVTDASLLPTNETFTILIESELLKVTAINISTNTLTVIRGVEGTTAVSHANGILVIHVASVFTFDRFREDNSQATTWSNRLTSALHQGRLLFFDDTLFNQLDNGTITPIGNNYFGPIRKLTPPLVSDYTWINQGTATADNNNGGLWLYSNGITNGDNLRILKRTIPAFPFTLSVCIYPCWDDKNFLSAGIGLRESSTGKVESIQYEHVDNVTHLIEQDKWNSETSWNSQRGQVFTKNLPFEVRWLRIYHDGTTIHYYYSSDSYHWFEFGSFAKNNFFTTDANEYILYINVNGQANDSTLNVGANYLSVEIN